MGHSKTTRGVVTVALGLALVAGGASAAPPSFTHAASIYRDELETPLRFPEGVACTEEGTVVVADSGNGRLVRYRYEEGRLSGGSPVVVAEVPYPTRVQIDRKGGILVLDRKARRIARLDMAGTFVSFLDLKGPSGAPVRVGAFKLDASDNAYVHDLATDKLLVVAPSGSITRQIDLPRSAVTDIAVDAAGKIYAVDAGTASVWVAERGATAFKVLAAGMRDYLSFPGYVATAGGRLFVVDQNGHGIVTIGLDGSYHGRQLGLGWSDGFLYYPSQACFVEKGYAVVADRSNHRVQIFKTSR